jgi:flavodoxin
MISFALIAYAKTCSTAINAKNYKAEMQMLNDFIDKEQQVRKADKTLTVYYSYTDDTRKLANMIHEKVGGDILEIQPLELYPDDYNAVYAQGRKEVEERIKPQLNNNFTDISEYGTIYLGSPIWFETIAPPVASFLYGQSLAGKTIIPFCTYDGLGAGQSIEEIAHLSPNARVTEGFAVKRTEVEKSREALAKWLKK